MRRFAIMMVRKYLRSMFVAIAERNNLFGYLSHQEYMLNHVSLSSLRKGSWFIARA